MKKGFFAVLMAVLVALVAVKPALAASINADEQKVYDEFCAVLDGYSWLSDAHRNQYKGEAQSALAKVDLSASACAEFSQCVKDVQAELAGVTSQAQAKQHLSAVLGIVNKVANKYNMSVSVDSKNDAHVTVTTASGSTTTVATTKSAVKQTGFSFGQTAAMVAAAAAVLAGAFLFARKNELFA